MIEFKEEYINRDIAYYLLNKYASNDNQPRAIRRAAKMLLSFPVSDVRKNVSAEWLFNDDDNMFNCSECKKQSIRNDYPFCHWCGAVMKRTEALDG